MEGKLSPSLQCADLLHLEDSVRALERIKADYLHFDVMDGRFVPNFALGPDTARAVRGITAIPFDYHFMVEEPERHFPLFPIGPGDLVSVHVEAVTHLQRCLSEIRRLGAVPALALNPSTPLLWAEEVLEEVGMVLVMTVNPGFAGQRLVPSTLPKILRLRDLLEERGRGEVLIGVDGNVSAENAAGMRCQGAGLFVAGTSGLFLPGIPLEEAASALRRGIRQGNPPGFSVDKSTKKV